MDFCMPNMESRTTVGFWVGIWEEPLQSSCLVMVVKARGGLLSCWSAAGFLGEGGQPFPSQPCCRRGSRLQTEVLGRGFLFLALK